MKTPNGEVRTLKWFLIASVVGLVGTALAQSYSVDWFKIAGGGGTSTGGVYAVSGTIGQPDASQQAMTGGNYLLVGGFWSLFAIQTPGAPYLSVTHTATNSVVVSWPKPAEGWNLEYCTALTSGTNVWTQISPPYQTNATDWYVTEELDPAGNKFYRLKKQ